MNKPTVEYVITRNKVMQRYGYDMLAETPDYNIYSALFFNPYYSISDVFKTLKNIFSIQDEQIKYLDFLFSQEFDKFSLLSRTEYQIPYYNINGDHDYQTNVFQAEKYFNIVKAPRKKFYKMNNMNHGLLEVRSGEFSDLMHEIAELEKTGNFTVNVTN